MKGAWYCRLEISSLTLNGDTKMSKGQVGMGRPLIQKEKLRYIEREVEWKGQRMII